MDDKELVLTPKHCIACRRPFVLHYDLPKWIKEHGGGGSYGGPISTPQCNNCGQPAYMSGGRWHVKRPSKTKTFTVGKITLGANDAD